MERLYIIGNGFDLFHGLATGFCDFKKYLEKNDKTLLEYMEENFEGDLWSDFESALGKINMQELLEENLDHLPGEDSENTGELHGMADALVWETEEFFKNLKLRLNEWILLATNTKHLKPLLSLERNALFLTFNYSTTLEKYYFIKNSQVFHIHGEAHELPERDKRYGDDDIIDIVIGHAKELLPSLEKRPKVNGIQNFSLDDAIEVIENLHRRLFKNTKQIIGDNHSFFSSLKSINKIIVIGHSISEVDQEYFSKVVQSVRSDADWLITYYGRDQYTETFSRAKKMVPNVGRCDLIDLNRSENLRLLD